MDVPVESPAAAPPAQPAPPNPLLDLVRHRLRRIGVAEHVRARAAAALKSEGMQGQDEPRVWKDWLSDVLSDPDPETFEEAAADPARAYLDYVRARAGDPFRVHYRAVDALARQCGADRANDFVHVRWWQEIAWAQRLRTSPDERVAFLAQAFLRAAAQDPGKAFQDLAGAREAAIEDVAFATAPEHALTVGEIRAGGGGKDFSPSFLRLYETRLAPKLDHLPEQQLRFAAQQARAAEEADVRGLASQGGVTAARRTPLRRMLGVLQVALETGRDADMLVADEARFLTDVTRGRMPRAVSGLPYSEFLQWLRATPPGEVPDPPPIGGDAHRALVSALAVPQAWIRRLPPDYLDNGARDVATFRAWSAPLREREGRIPLDAVADYGMHLVRSGFRQPQGVVRGTRRP